MSRVPYIRFFSDDWLAGTMELSLDERGALITIVALIAATDGPIDADYERLSRRFGITKGKAEKIVTGLVNIGKISINNGLIFNDRALSEVEIAHNFSQKQSERRKSFGLKNSKKHNKNNENNKPRFNRGSTKPEPEPLKIKKDGEWVLAAIPDEGTKASTLCEIVISGSGQGAWVAWFNRKHVVFDGDDILPVTDFAAEQIRKKFNSHIRRAGMTLGETWAEGATA